MIDSQNSFFIIERSPDNEGVPAYMAKEYKPELPDFSFNIFEKPADPSQFAEKYFIKAKASKLDGDFLPEDFLASIEFINLCNKLNVKHIQIPVDLKLYRDKTPEKKYFLFFMLTYLDALDEEKSEFIVSVDINTGKPNTPEGRGLERTYYEKIDKFYVKDDISENLFFCREISKPVCSNKFKEKYESLNLKGIKFTAIDDNYKFDAWAGW